MLGARLVHHRLVHVRIEVGAERVDRPHALLAQQVVQLGVNQLDALAVRGAAVAGVDGQRAVEIVDDEQQLQQQIDDRLVGLLAALALDALAVVVELGGLAQPAIVDSRRARAAGRRRLAAPPPDRSLDLRP